MVFTFPKDCWNNADSRVKWSWRCEGVHLVLRPATKPRNDWDLTSHRMLEHGDDTLLDPESLTATEWEIKEWEWESAASISTWFSLILLKGTKPKNAPMYDDIAG